MEIEFENPNIVLAAGMPRSASTWLYNVARLVLMSKPDVADSFSCGWVDNWKSTPHKKYNLVKMHDFNDELVSQATFILYSYRDIRDSLASCQRKFGQLPSVEHADKLIEQHERWIDVANFVMPYKNMLYKRELVVAQLMDALNVSNVDQSEILQSISGLGYDSEGDKNGTFNEMNLYHRNHITNGRIGSWKEQLDEKIVNEIEEKHQAWFEKYGYELTNK